MSKSVKFFLSIVVCLGILAGGLFSYKKYLDNKNNESKKDVNTKIEEQDNKEDIKYKIIKKRNEKYVEELSEEKYNIKDEIGTTKVTISNKNTKELVKEYQFSDNEGCSFNKIIYDEKILGYIENHYYEEDNRKTKICTYLNDCFETDYEVIGEGVRLGCDDDYYTNNKDAIIVGKDDKVALLSLRTGKLVSDFVYDDMYGINDNHYISIKDGKSGIVDEKYNVLVDFVYDFIDAYEAFYVVCKDGKLAIMDENYKLITDFSIVANFDPKDYSYTPCCGYENPLYAIKVGNNYVLNTHNADYWHNELKEQDAYMYLIKADGSYEKIDNAWYLLKFNDTLFYVTNNKRISSPSENATIKEISTFYDNNFNKLYTINDEYFDSIFPNVMESGSDEDSKFYDTTTGKEILTLPKYEFYNISLEYVKVQLVGGYTSWEYNLYVDGNLFLKDINNVKFNKDGSFTFSDYENGIEYDYELQKIN